MNHLKESKYGINISGTIVNNLRFADDIDLIGEECSSLQKQFEITRIAAEETGLVVNATKTKTMVFGERNIEEAVQMAGTTIENVDKFEYLESQITWDNNCSDEIKRRIGKATGAMASLKHIWSGKKLTIQNKLRILTICVFSVLPYVSETWTLKEADKRKLLAFEMRWCRRILKINWKDMIRNEDIRKRISKEEIIIDIIKKIKLRLFGHIRRMHDNGLVKHTVFGKIDGKLRRRRSCREWLDDIKDWCGHSVQDLYHLAQDRRVWKKLICAVVGPNGR